MRVQTLDCLPHFRRDFILRRESEGAGLDLFRITDLAVYRLERNYLVTEIRIDRLHGEPLHGVVEPGEGIDHALLVDQDRQMDVKEHLHWRDSEIPKDHDRVVNGPFVSPVHIRNVHRGIERPESIGIEVPEHVVVVGQEDEWIADLRILTGQQDPGRDVHVLAPVHQIVERDMFPDIQEVRTLAHDAEPAKVLAMLSKRTDRVANLVVVVLRIPIQHVDDIGHSLPFFSASLMASSKAASTTL